jgi:cysteine desulfurase
MTVYFDNASTTPLLEEVKEEMIRVVKNYFGNPSSIHRFGREAKTLVEEARKMIARGLNSSTGEIFFTCGATEGNNMALLASIRDLGVQQIISSPTEHHCITHTLDYIVENNLAEVRFLKVDKFGHIDYDELNTFLSESGKKSLVSLMHANNEIGTLHDIERIAGITSQNNALFHCDTAQSMGKYPFDLETLKVDFLSGSAHKFFGPKGAGFMYIRNENMLKPMLFGGSQERGVRSGTENIYGIAGMSMAFQLAIEEMEQRHEYVHSLKNYFHSRLESELDDIQFNGDPENQLYNVISASFPASGKSPLMMMNLDIAGISASAGSACSSGVENDSHVLAAIGHDPQRKTVRFSLSHLNTRDEVDYVIKKLKTMTPALHETS